MKEVNHNGGAGNVVISHISIIGHSPAKQYWPWKKPMTLARTMQFLQVTSNMKATKSLLEIYELILSLVLQKGAEEDSRGSLQKDPQKYFGIYWWSLTAGG